LREGILRTAEFMRSGMTPEVEPAVQGVR